MKRTICVACVALLGLSVQPVFGVKVSGASADAVRLTARLDDVEVSGPRLQLELENAGSEPLQINESFLPWGIRTSLLLVAIVADAGGERIPERLLIEDLGTGQTVIAAHGKRSGTVDLSRRFPTLADERKRHEVILLWSFVPLLASAEAKQRRITGVLLLPKKL